MIYLEIVLGYVVLLAGLIRFFQTVYQWDEEIKALDRSHTHNLKGV
jgi:hypothetical protein